MTQSSPTHLGFLPASTFWQAGHVCGEHVLPYPCAAPLVVYAWVEVGVSSFSSLLLFLPSNPCFSCRLPFSIYKV